MSFTSTEAQIKPYFWQLALLSSISIVNKPNCSALLTRAIMDMRSPVVCVLAIVLLSGEHHRALMESCLLLSASASCYLPASATLAAISSLSSHSLARQSLLLLLPLIRPSSACFHDSISDRQLEEQAAVS